jgi:uncharacterized protein YndB with AHSA1/START domain
MAKEKFELEFVVRSAPKVLYNRLATPGGLSEWFADNVNIKGDRFFFIWDGAEEEAILLNKNAGESIRFQWVDDEDTDYYFEFGIKIDKLTKEAALIITDFAEPDEKESAIMLWESQVHELLHILGS